MEDRLRFLGCGLPIFFDLRPEIQDRHGGYRIYPGLCQHRSRYFGYSRKVFARPEIVVFELVKEK